jgi:hypothetical protein
LLQVPDNEGYPAWFPAGKAIAAFPRPFSAIVRAKTANRFPWFVGARRKRSPDERSDIRGASLSVHPNIATPMRATVARLFG